MTENLYIVHCVRIENPEHLGACIYEVFGLKKELGNLIHDVEWSRLLKYCHKVSEVSFKKFIFIFWTKG